VWPVEFRETVTIDATAADVVPIMNAVEDWPSWTASVSWVRRSATGPLSVGETITVKQPRLPAGTWTVTAVDGLGFTWTSSSLGVRSTGDHWAREDGGQTTVELTLTLAGPLARLTGLLYAGLIRRYVRLEANGLRDEVTRRRAA